MRLPMPSDSQCCRPSFASQAFLYGVNTEKGSPECVRTSSSSKIT